MNNIEAILEKLKKLQERGVRWIEVHFTDLAGFLRAFETPLHEIDEKSIEKGLGQLDGSSVRGFTTISESDLVLKLDFSTMSEPLPWNPKKVRVIADVYMSMGRGRFNRDPRYVAQKTVEYLAEQGYKAYFGPEVEFMLLDSLAVDVFTPATGLGYTVSSRESPLESQGYFQSFKQAYHTPTPIDQVAAIRQEIAETLEDAFGFHVEASHHEVAATGQIEIDFRFGELVETADRVITLKYVARNIAAKYGMVAVFMPKPIAGDNGNGMHTHVSLWDKDGKKNLFFDPNDEYAELSQTARYFIGGLLEHGRALAALVAPTTNSYRRLVPGFEAPIYLVWSKANRSAAVRVPIYFKGEERAKRIEFRPPDPSANPYLAFSALVLAGLDGIKKKIEPGDPVDKDVYHMTQEEKRQLGIRELPRNLEEALDELESDHEFLKPVFSEDLIETYIELKREEAKTEKLYVNPIEVYMYAWI